MTILNVPISLYHNMIKMGGVTSKIAGKEILRPE
jgi:hypothetical protein